MSAALMSERLLAEPIENPPKGSCHEQFQLETRRRAGESQWLSLSQRERRLSPRPRGPADRGDRASPPYRTGRRTAPRASARRRGHKELRLRGRKGIGVFRRPVRRQEYA